MFKSVKALKNKISTVFNLFFANNTILLCFFFFFSIIDLDILIPAAAAQIFTVVAELAIPIGIPTKKAKGEIETDPATAEKEENVRHVFL